MASRLESNPGHTGERQVFSPMRQTWISCLFLLHLCKPILSSWCRCTSNASLNAVIHIGYCWSDNTHAFTTNLFLSRIACSHLLHFFNLDLLVGGVSYANSVGASRNFLATIHDHHLVLTSLTRYKPDVVPVTLFGNRWRDAHLIGPQNGGLQLALACRVRHLDRYVHLVANSKALWFILQFIWCNCDLSWINNLRENRKWVNCIKQPWCNVTVSGAHRSMQFSYCVDDTAFLHIDLLKWFQGFLLAKKELESQASLKLSWSVNSSWRRSGTLLLMGSWQRNVLYKLTKRTRHSFDSKNVERSDDRWDVKFSVSEVKPLI